MEFKSIPDMHKQIAFLKRDRKTMATHMVTWFDNRHSQNYIFCYEDNIRDILSFLTTKHDGQYINVAKITILNDQYSDFGERVIG